MNKAKHRSKRESFREWELWDIEYNKETFSEWYETEAYRAMRNITNSGRDKCCKCCMYCDNIKKKCLANTTQKVKYHLCLKAQGILKLKESGLYGQKTNPKTTVN